MNRSLSYRLCLSLPLACALLASALPVDAAGPWETLAPFKKIDADPNSMYPITQSNGPWMIMATTFRGEKAADQARQLAYELRSRYKLPVYTYEKTFDFTKRELGRGVKPDGTPKTMKYQQDELVKEVAVLVGDFDTVDDAGAQKVLAKLKYLEPDALKGEQAKSSQSLAAFRQLQKTFMTSSNENRKKGPLGHAFIATNPLLPREYFAGKGIDKLVLDMNKDVKYSLLDCKGKYSVKVATFTGSVLIDQSKIREVEAKKKSLQSRLADAADKAHQLTMVLRDKKYDAYEFHDRETSIVCVGSFDAVGMPRADGKIEIDPRVHAILKTFGADQGGLASGTALKPKYINDIPLDIQPMPVEVPRRSFSADYQRSMRDLR